MYQVLSILVGIVAVLGILWNIVHRAVVSANDSLKKDIDGLRNDLRALHNEFHKDFRQTGERIARVEAKIESTENQLDWFRFRGAVSGQRMETS